VATLVRDGDTLQFGIGAVPSALAGALCAHRRLRIHGGMVSAALQKLWEAWQKGGPKIVQKAPRAEMESILAEALVTIAS
jgi:acyl-CoA hydrolase